MIAKHFPSAALLALFASWAASGQTYTISTVPGSALPLNSLQFPGAEGVSTGPAGVAVDSGGNLFFPVGSIVVLLNIATGTLVTVAGGGTSYPGDNGPATSAGLNPSGVAVDSAGNLFIGDRGDRIRKVSNGVITTVAGNGTAGFSGDGGPATSAQLNCSLCGIAADSAGNLYVADLNNRRVREVTNGVITTVAGNGNPGLGGDNGPATSAQLDLPFGLAVDAAGNLYIAEQGARVRKVSNGVINTIAGNGTPGFSGDGGPATNAELSGPEGVAVDSSGNVYVADSQNGRIRVLNPSPVPSINLNGIVPIDSTVPVVQPGSWASIYGQFLANGTYLWNNDFPTSLGNVSVTIDKKAAYLWVVSPTQINLQVPDDTTTGIVNVAVDTPNGTVNSTITLAQYAPSFSLLGDGKHVAGVIPTPDGNGAYGGGTYDLVGPENTFSFSTRPVQQGETLTLYGVGFGPTTPHVPAGQPFSGIASTNSPVTITIGGVAANVSFAGITEAGLYQLNLTVPPGTGEGDQPVRATVSGIQTPVGPVVTVQ